MANTTDYIVKNVTETTIQIASVDGITAYKIDGKVDENAARRMIAKALGHKNFFIVPGTIEYSTQTYRLPRDKFMELAKPRDKFPTVQRVVVLRLYGTTVTYVTPSGTDKLYIDGKITDAQVRKAIRSHIGHQNFYISETVEKHEELAMSLAAFIDVAECLTKPTTDENADD